MIAPELEEGINRQTSRLVLLRNNLLASALIFLGLEVWRPYFFLTDDNLDGGYPFFVEMGNHLLSGRSPFYSDHLFGGHYFLLGDACFFAWHPVYLLASLLVGTPFRLCITDVIAFALFMLATAGFVNLAYYLRREMSLKVSDGWLMFYTLSFTYSMMALTMGASWLTFMGNESALPWLALGILQKSWRSSLGLVTLFTLHQVLGGHLSPTVSCSIFLTFFALGVSLWRRSVLPLGCWLAGYALALVIILPLLIPMIEGFSSSWRSEGVPLDDMQSYRIPARLFPTSLFLGMALWIIHPPEHQYTTYTLAMGSCGAAWCLIPALVSRARWRGLEIVTLVLMIILAVLICRPAWISKIMLHLPLFKSMRWPFRELILFQFFLHLFLLLRPPGLTIPTQRRMAIFSLGIFLIPMLLYPLPPTLNSMSWDRRLLLSGRTEIYWDRVRPLLKPTDRIAVLIPFDLYMSDRFEEPYSLLGTYNYAILARVINAWGYSPTFPLNHRYTKTIAFYPFGAYRPEQKLALMAERPELRFITLESLKPLRITLSSRAGPTIDLTPYIPPEIKGH